MLSLLLMTALGAADAPAVETLEIVGFSDNGKRFAAVVSDPGASEGQLTVRDVATGRVRVTQAVPIVGGRAQLPAELLASNRLGGDPGQEKYAKGTKSRADVDLAGPLIVEIVSRAEDGPYQPMVKIGRGPWCTTARTLEVPGTNHNLLSVLASRDGNSLVVVLKHTVAGTRRHAFVTAVPDASQARCRAGELPPTEAQDRRCREAAAKLPSFVSDEEVRDFEGGAELPRYCASFEKVDGELTFGVSEEPAVGLIAAGKVESCWLTDDAFTLRLANSRSDAREVFDVQLVLSDQGRAARVQSNTRNETIQVPAASFRRGKKCR